jgi:adenylate cyclase
MDAVRHRLVELALVVCSLALCWAIQTERINNAATEAFEFFIRDVSQLVLADETEELRLAVVDIHEESIRQIGPWPWPRQRLADLSTALLTEHGAALVVLDMVFPDPRDLQGDNALQRLGLEGKLVFSEVFDYNQRQVPIRAGEVSAGINPKAMPGSQAIEATGIMGNHKTLAQTPCVGNIGFVPDPDGQVRRLPLLTEWQGRIYPGLSLASLLCLNMLGPEELDRMTGPWPLRFRHADSSWLTIPAADILGRKPIPSLQGRIVIVGSSALGLSDRVATPLSNSVAGVFIHAQALSELLDIKQLPQPVSSPLMLWLQLAMVAGLALAILISRQLRWLLMAGLSLAFVWLVLAGWQSITAGQGVITAVVWASLFLLVSLMPWEWFYDRRAAQTNLGLLGRYVAPAVLKELMRSRSQLNPLAPRSREVTALVADMADYSAITRSLPLEDAAFVTRSFLEALTVPVWSYRGTLDRYSGDGLVAFWGAPLEQPDQTDLAMDAAQAMVKAVQELNERLQARLLPRLEVRIGIARSQALVGDFGTRYRAAYTAVGNCINLAARLEALAKDLKETVLVSKDAAQAMSRHSLTVLEPVAIKGFGSLTIYKPKGLQ